MRTSIHLGRIKGVSVGASWSFFAITAFVGISLAFGVLPRFAPRHAPWEYGTAGALTAVAFMATVVAHEFAHAMTARREGIEPEGITLWLLGGFTKLPSEPTSPKAETLISGAGPAASIVLGILAAGAAVGFQALHVSTLVFGSLAWLGAMNVLLGVLNLLPASPLDGGHLLHAAVWRITGNELRATSVAARSGQVVGWTLAGGGTLAALYGYLGGLWVALTGWMIASAAALEGGRAKTESALSGLQASDVMIPTPFTIPGWLTVEAVMEDGLAGPARPALPVERWGGGLAGVVGLEQLYALPAAERSHFRVADLAWPIEEVPLIRAEEPAAELVARFSGSSPWAVVLSADGSKPIGLISGPALLARAAHWPARGQSQRPSSAVFPN